MTAQTSILERKVFKQFNLAQLLLAGIILLSIGLHFSNLSAIGDANTYYTAAVKSMLLSWKNFFFVAAEPGGSVSVDKPPLGLWVEAAFAFALGVSGFSTSLPNMLAGVLSVPLLYALVERYMGKLAGLIAALVLVITPVALATDRNNTMDGLLVFVLLLAAWAFVRATESGKLGWLLLGGLIVGLGFNIKMLQALLPLPAFYALYFFGARTGWGRKIINLGLVTALILAVSFSWAIAVDLTPADSRPYVGSSEDNTVMELIMGHNGLSRLFNPRADNAVAQNPATPDGAPNTQNPGGQGGLPAGNGAPPAALAACENASLGDTCTFTPPNGNTIEGTCIQPRDSNQLACAPQGRPGINPPAGALGDGPGASPDMPNSNGGTPFSQETGSPSWNRFFTAPLSKQMSWLLPFALAGVVALAFATRIRLPLTDEHKALVLWGGWLLTCIVFFSAVEGIFHAYYTIMLAPALGAMVGMGAAQFWRWQTERRSFAPPLLVAAAVATLAFQVYAVTQYGLSAAWMVLPVLMLLAAAGLALRPTLRRTAFALLMISILLVPFFWTGMTVFDELPNAALPTASQVASNQQERPLNERNPVNTDLLDYLQANTKDIEYLVAVPNAHTGSSLVLASGRPVLYIGGFGGSDPVIDAEGLANMVANGQLRYVLFGQQNQKQDISRWLENACQVVPQFSQSNRTNQSGPGTENNILYRCD